MGKNNTDGERYTHVLRTKRYVNGSSGSEEGLSYYTSGIKAERGMAAMMLSFMAEHERFTDANGFSVRVTQVGMWDHAEKAGVSFMWGDQKTEMHYSVEKL